MNIKGVIMVINSTQQVSARFCKRDFVIQDNSSQYPQMISFQTTQDRTFMLDKFKVGQEVEVHFNLRGREWKSPQGETKFFNTIEAWKIEPTGITMDKPVEEYVDNPDPLGLDTKEPFLDGTSDDLPF